MIRSEETSAWQAMLAEYSTELHSTQHDAPPRVVIVGDSGAGKRCLADRLCDPAMRRKPTAASGSGLLYTFHDVRTASGVLRAVEIYCCDAPGLLRVALPTKEAVERTFVIFAVDASAPQATLATLQLWRGCVDAHVASLLSADERAVLVSRRVAEWASASDALAATRRVHLEAANVFETATGADAFALSTDSVSTLPALVALTKFDVFERQLKGGTPSAAAGAAGGLTPAQFLLQTLRRAAIEARVGLFCAASRSNASSMATLAAGVWAYICGHLGYILHDEVADSPSVPASTAPSGNVSATQPPAVSVAGVAVGSTGGASGGGVAAAAAAAASGDASYLRHTSIADSISLDASATCFLPRGFDSLGHLSPQVLAEMQLLSDIFKHSEPPVPTIRRHEDVIKGLTFASATYDATDATMAWDE